MRMSFTTDHVVCAMSKASGITSVEKWMASKTPVKMDGIAPGTSTPDNATRIFKAALGLPIQLVIGYKGTAEVRLAAESGDPVVVLQANRRAHPDLPQVPQAIKPAKTDEGRKMIDVGIHSNSDIVRTYTLPPGTPKDRVQLLRKSFEDTLKDPEFLADAKKAKLNVDPVPADAVEKDISALFKLDPAIVAKL